MRTLIIIGHPIAGSFSHAIGARYADAVAGAAENEVRVIDLAAIEIDSTPRARGELQVGRDGDRSHLDPLVLDLIADVEWADHLVVVYPQWWGTYPATLKAFIDRVVLSGVSYRAGRGQLSTPLWAGRTARIIMTMDAPRYWNRLVYRNASETSLARATFAFTGVKTIGITRFTPVRFSTPERRAAWLDRIASLGKSDAARRRPRHERTRREPITTG